MGKEHNLEKRRRSILDALEAAGELSVGTLVERFQVSEVTIRQDLQNLSDRNLIVRTRGGAISLSSPPELSFEIRQRQNAEQKARIARAAAALIHPGDSVILDASTTTQAVIPYLKLIPELTVITNSLKAGISLLHFPHIHVIVPGGSLRRDAISLVGSPENEFFKGLNAQVGFFGARGITLEQGLTDVNLEEARVKHRMVQMCQRVVGLLDGSKWGRMSVVTFAALAEIHLVITDASAPAEMVAAVRQRGVEVTVV